MAPQQTVRLELLEKKVRTLKLCVSTLTLTFVAIISLAAIHTPTKTPTIVTSDAISTKHLGIVDVFGNERVVLKTGDDGTGTVQIKNEDGTVVCAIWEDKKGGLIWVGDQEDRARAMIVPTGEVLLFNEAGAGVAHLAADKRGHGQLNLYEKGHTDKSFLSAGIMNDGNADWPVIGLRHPREGLDGLRLGVTQDLGGAIASYDKSNQLRPPQVEQDQ